ncbi:Kinase, NEK [Giardia muris]|uniref:Kinase, NEK n=1 Tax=Giardia muris TaxID=5742 RepID=A0A4Z1TA01_GIAMU|nr:Kinase, NEK [Giardia muris]|eukprot:TNJ29351.1 Kinase, NEK [Giardia muris]
MTNFEIQIPSGFDDPLLVYRDAYAAYYDAIEQDTGENQFLVEVYLPKVDPIMKPIISRNAGILMLVSHPHVLRTYDAYTDVMNRLFLAQEFTGHGRLNEYLEHCRAVQRSIPEDTVWDIAALLVETLTTIKLKARKGQPTTPFVHGHLTPTAIYITKNNQLKLGQLEYHLLIGTQACLTPLNGIHPYAAPECFTDGTLTQESDVWSLGCLLAELCLGKPPFSIPSGMDPVTFFSQPHPIVIPALYSADLRSLINNLLVLDPTRRSSLESLKSSPILIAKYSALSKRDFVVFGDYIYQPQAVHTPSPKVLPPSSPPSTSIPSPTIFVPPPPPPPPPPVFSPGKGVPPIPPQLQRPKSEVLMVPQPVPPSNPVTTASSTPVESSSPIYTPLMKAVLAGSTTDAIDHLSEKGKYSSNGLTALMLAAERDSLELVKLLIGEIRMQAGEMAGPEPWKAGATALHFAASKNATAVAPLLLENEVDLPSTNGYTALMVAAMNNSVDVIPLLLERQGGRVLSNTQENGKTALMLAAEQGHEAVCTLLLKKEGTMTLVDTGKTALMYAAERGHVGAIGVLKRREAKMTLRDGFIIPGATATMLAVLNRQYEALPALVDAECGVVTLISNADVNPDFGLSEKPLASVYTNKGITALMLAAQLGFLEAVRPLYGKESGIGRPTDGLRAYDIVVNFCSKGSPPSKYASIIEHLQPELNVTRDEELNTDLILAADKGDIDGVQKFYDQVRLQNNRGKTALMACAERGHLECAKLLAKKEAGLHNSSGWTALMIAAMFGKTDLAKLLLADEVGMVTIDGWTALMGAAYSNHPEIVKLLLEKEAGRATNALYYDGAGWTALLLAAKRSNLEAVRLLIDGEMMSRLPPTDAYPKGRTVLDVAGAKIRDWVIGYVREHIARRPPEN